MAEDEEKDRGFKIEDKRRFDASGDPRLDGGDEQAEAEQPEEIAEPAQAKAKREKQGSAEPKPPDQGSAALEPEDRLSADPQLASQQASGELSFSSFVVGLASQAFMFLGAMPDPQSGVVRKDLAQAKAMIDILAMLGEKTAGNLNADEERMMEEMLYELRMQYISETRAPAGRKEGGA